MSKMKGSAFKIDKGIKVPPVCGLGRPPIYPWAEMKVGDSFVAGKCARNIASKRNRTHKPLSYVSRKEGSNFRIWRVA